MDIFNVDLTDLTLSEVPADSLRETKFWIDFAIQQQHTAVGMNRLVRFFSSNDRAMPSNIFDAPLTAMKNLGGDNALGDMVMSLDGMTGFRSRDVQRSLRSHGFVAAVKQALRDAGFDLAVLGMSSITD